MPTLIPRLRGKNRFALGVSVVLLLVVGPASGAEPAPEEAIQTISADELVRRVEARDPRLALLQARIDRARADIAAADRTLNPSLGYERQEVFADGEGMPEDKLVVSWPIALSGRRPAAVRAARSELAATEAEVALLRTTLVLDALAAYHEAALAAARVARLTEDRARLGALQEIIAKRLAAGQASSYDQTRLALELGSWDDLLAGAASELEAARRRLALLAGEPGRRFDASEAATVPALPPLPDAATIVSQRPDHIAARHRREAARHARSAATRPIVLAVAENVRVSTIP